MKAMLFAAGIGSRLQPLTYKKPKALIEVDGKPMIEHALLLLKKHGFSDVIINLHHFPEQIKAFLIQKNFFGVNISFSEEDELLDTGGGLKKASWFFEDDPFLIFNVDILTNIDLGKLLQYHISQNNIATLVVRNRKSSRYLLFDEENYLVGWEKIKSQKTIRIREVEKQDRYAFSGIHIVDPKLFTFFPSQKKFSIIQLYLDIAKKENIRGFTDDDSYWFDIGNLEKLEKAIKFMGQQKK